MVHCGGDGDGFTKTICKDFDPVVEDLQVISICGHVFHELCLQESFGYYANKKRNSCPVCKQSCNLNDVVRVYFQWADPNLSQSQNQRSSGQCEEDSEALRQEVRRLEAVALGLASDLELKEKELKLVKEELCQSKVQAKIEVALKNEALKQRTSAQQQLQMKSEECDKLTLESLRLRERNKALDKELAVVKLVSDLDLDKEDVSKLATFGDGANNKDIIYVLSISFAMSNSKKLEKAKRKINKWKTKAQDLETAVEVKSTELLKALKALKKASKKAGVAAAETKKETSVHGLRNLAESLGLSTGTCNDAAKTPASDIAEVVIIDDNEQVQPMLNIKKECFGQYIMGLLGPDGTNRYIGKWCKPRHKNVSAITQDPIPMS
ncbi:flagellar attachment zone protein 1-like [Pyrus ussuriensis x Pyrus communis]|uniref:Flagellar attachment zone protein 1-like n=1 Tax=Pyrus ussuriensis x Pyrus communis TaxID=2448454 RepID=A0A5N5F440_9ROSA|nr:flagellar attachment zone protein 1-like [Pyrus ussuriensis x Pyrus communis]